MAQGGKGFGPGRSRQTQPHNKVMSKGTHANRSKKTIAKGPGKVSRMKVPSY